MKKNNIIRTGFAAALFSFASAINAPADVKTVTATDDNFMYSATAPTCFSDKNWGNNRNMLVGINNPAQDKYRSLLRFDLSSLDDATEVSSATLTLTVSVVAKIKPANGNFTVNLFLLNNANKGWREGDGDGAIKPGASCWDYLDHKSTVWTGAAGAGNSTASAGISALVGSVTINTGSEIAIGKKVSFTINSPEGLAAIKAWIKGGDNAGFLLATDELSAGQNTIGFYASEATDSSGRPKLEIKN
jgi:hypothetical protein